MSDSSFLKPLKMVRGLAAVSLIAGAALAAQPALACTMQNWTDQFGDVYANNPLNNSGEDVDGNVSNVGGVQRYSGFCGMRAGPGTGFVEDDRPGNIDRIVARFYVLRNSLGSGTPIIYAGYGSNDAEAFRVTMNAAGTVTLIDSATGQSVSQSGSTNWMSIEIDWGRAAGDGFIKLSVNGQADVENDTLNNAGSPQLSYVRLGNVDGAASGTITFDSYESRRSTAVGRLMVADANNDGVVNVVDVTALSNELLNDVLTPGQPDCNEDGEVNVVDITCLANIILN